MSPGSARGSVNRSPTNVPRAANTVAPNANGQEPGHQRSAPSAPARSTAPRIASGAAAALNGSTAPSRPEWTADAARSVRPAKAMRIRISVFIRSGLRFSSGHGQDFAHDSGRDPVVPDVDRRRPPTERGEGGAHLTAVVGAMVERLRESDIQWSVPYVSVVLVDLSEHRVRVEIR